MARSATAAKGKTPVTKKPEDAFTARVVGKAVLTSLDKVQPNDWNPNEMTPFQVKSLKNGMQTDGWVASQALLVWGTDDKGKVRNIIIDGEHRYLVAKELGFKKGPMVFLTGVSESAARAFTVKMDARRGKFNEVSLGELLRSIQNDIDVPDFALELGIEDVMKYLGDDAENLAGAGGEDVPPPGQIEMASGKMSHVKMVQLFFDEKQHEEFMGFVQKVSTQTSTNNITDTVMAGMRRACAASK